jgi:hypothetical protein
MLPAKFGFIWPSSFRGEDFFNSSQSENLAGSIYVRSSIKFLCFIPFGQQIWLPRAILVSCFLPSLAPFGQAVSEIFLTVANQKKELLLVAMFVGQMEPYEEAL